MARRRVPRPDTLLGNDVTEWGVTLGSGIPFRSGNARADVMIGYSKIGSVADNGAEESVFRLMFSVTGGETTSSARTA